MLDPPFINTAAGWKPRLVIALELVPSPTYEPTMILGSVVVVLVDWEVEVLCEVEVLDVDVDNDVEVLCDVLLVDVDCEVDVD